MADTDLRDVLVECQTSARAGYRISSAQEKKLRNALSLEEERIQSAMGNMWCSLPICVKIQRGRIP